MDGTGGNVDTQTLIQGSHDAKNISLFVLSTRAGQYFNILEISRYFIRQYIVSRKFSKYCISILIIFIVFMHATHKVNSLNMSTKAM